MNTSTTPQKEWHNYGSGSIYWRVTAQGVEVKGKGLLKNPKFTKQAANIWKSYQQPIVAAAKKHGVPIPAIIATISTESSGNPKAHRVEPAYYNRYIKDQSKWKDSPYYKFPERIAASYGLVQIMYPTAYNIGFRGKPEDLYDPAVNIDAGAAYMASQVKMHHWDPPKIGAAYNAGSVRATTQNAWGLHTFGDHLDRWIPAYNGAIEIIGSAAAVTPAKPAAPAQSPAAVIPPKPTVPVQPPPPAVTPAAPAPQPAGQQITLQLLLPGGKGTTWKPIIVDIFEHTDSGVDEPVSHTITAPRVDPNSGNMYEISGMAPGVYDFVFSDAGSGAVLYDIAEVEVQKAPTVLDLRQNLGAAVTAPA